jgi:hypothetical protein
MGGGGGLEPVSKGHVDWLQKVRDVDHEKYEANTNELLKEVSSEVGNRDDAAIHRHIEVLKEKLRNDLADTIEVDFGGSIRKHTYVSGISDVDALVLLSREEVGGASSRELIEEMARLVRERLPETPVRAGDMAVTISYADGTELQMLPAIRRGGKVQVPGGRSGDWSPLADPARFANELKSVNFRNSLSILPTIKLFKVIQDAKVPENARLSGYHVESLAVDAFKDYSGPMDRKTLLEHFVGHATSRVLTPVRDPTGQSELVDDYLGPPGSSRRRTTAAYLERLRTRMSAADRSGDTSAWAALVGAD